MPMPEEHEVGENAHLPANVVAGKALLEKYRLVKWKAERAGVSVAATEKLRCRILELEDALAGLELESQDYKAEWEAAEAGRKRAEALLHERELNNNASTRKHDDKTALVQASEAAAASKEIALLRQAMAAELAVAVSREEALEALGQRAKVWKAERDALQISHAKALEDALVSEQNLHALAFELQETVKKLKSEEAQTAALEALKTDAIKRLADAEVREREAKAHLLLLQDRQAQLEKEATAAIDAATKMLNSEDKNNVIRLQELLAESYGDFESLAKSFVRQQQLMHSSSLPHLSTLTTATQTDSDALLICSKPTTPTTATVETADIGTSPQPKTQTIDNGTETLDLQLELQREALAKKRDAEAATAAAWKALTARAEEAEHQYNELDQRWIDVQASAKVRSDVLIAENHELRGLAQRRGEALELELVTTEELMTSLEERDSQLDELKAALDLAKADYAATQAALAIAEPMKTNGSHSIKDSLEEHIATTRQHQVQTEALPTVSGDTQTDALDTRTDHTQTTTDIPAINVTVIGSTQTADSMPDEIVALNSICAALAHAATAREARLNLERVTSETLRRNIHALKTLQSNELNQMKIDTAAAVEAALEATHSAHAEEIAQLEADSAAAIATAREVALKETTSLREQSLLANAAAKALINIETPKSTRDLAKAHAEAAAACAARDFAKKNTATAETANQRLAAEEKLAEAETRLGDLETTYRREDARHAATAAAAAVQALHAAETLTLKETEAASNLARIEARLENSEQMNQREEARHAETAAAAAQHIIATAEDTAVKQAFETSRLAEIESKFEVRSRREDARHAATAAAAATNALLSAQHLTIKESNEATRLAETEARLETSEDMHRREDARHAATAATAAAHVLAVNKDVLETLALKESQATDRIAEIEALRRCEDARHAATAASAATHALSTAEYTALKDAYEATRLAETESRLEMLSAREDARHAATASEAAAHAIIISQQLTQTETELSSRLAETAAHIEYTEDRHRQEDARHAATAAGAAAQALVLVNETSQQLSLKDKINSDQISEIEALWRCEEARHAETAAGAAAQALAQVNDTSQQLSLKDKMNSDQIIEIEALWRCEEARHAATAAGAAAQALALVNDTSQQLSLKDKINSDQIIEIEALRRSEDARHAETAAAAATQALALVNDTSQQLSLKDKINSDQINEIEALCRCEEARHAATAAAAAAHAIAVADLTAQQLALGEEAEDGRIAEYEAQCRSEDARHAATAAAAAAQLSVSSTETELLQQALDGLKRDNEYLKQERATPISSLYADDNSMRLAVRASSSRATTVSGRDDFGHKSPSGLDDVRAVALGCEDKLRLHLDAAADGIAAAFEREYERYETLKFTAKRYRSERDAARFEVDAERRRADASAAAADDALARVGAERDNALERCAITEERIAIFEHGRADHPTADSGQDVIIANAVAAANAAASAALAEAHRLSNSLENARQEQKEAELAVRSAEAEIIAAKTSDAHSESSSISSRQLQYESLERALSEAEAGKAQAQRAASEANARVAVLETKAAREANRCERLEAHAAEMLSQLAYAERARLSLSAGKHSSASKLLKHVSTSTELAAATPVIFDSESNKVLAQRHGKDSFHTITREQLRALRLENNSLRTHRDELADDVAHLKTELSRTRLVLHGLEWYTTHNQNAITTTTSTTL